MEKHVFIIGSKGIPAKYGGFETFVEQLTGKQINKNIIYHVACMDTAAKEEVYHNVHCFHIKVPQIGPAKAVYYDLVAFHYCLNYIMEHRLKQPIVYVLACRIGPFIGRLKQRLISSGGKLYVNPDGHEWMRAKWNRVIRKYWKYSEKGMVRHADLLICDSKNIEMYIRTEYKKMHPRTQFIAYGADCSAKIDEDAYTNWCESHQVRAEEYYLVVGRFVPENNYETMLQEFMRSASSKDLVLVTNVEQNKFYELLKQKTKFDEDPRIKFVGTVYDVGLLAAIRTHAYGYFHGHEVGGTNPSLLEALGTTKLNLLLDVGFNQEVAEDAALYWNKEDGNLAGLIDSADTFLESRREEFEIRAKQRISLEYSWEKIVRAYEELFLGENQKEMVSVVVASYNGERYIKEQLDSILGQLAKQDEVIVSDDGSTDQTLSILLEYERTDDRVHVVSGPGLGIKKNIECAMKQSSLRKPGVSGYLFLADQDDVWEEDKVALVLDTFHETDADVVIHDAVVVDENCETIMMPSFFVYRGSGKGALKNIYKNTYMGCCMAIRSSVIEDSLPIPDDIEMHDQWIGVRNDLHGKGTVFLNRPLLKYRRHESNVSDFERNKVPVMIKNRWHFTKELWKYRK